MKLFFLFLLFICIGLVLGVSYKEWSNNTTEKSTQTTKFSLSNSPGKSIKGKILSLKGTVNWLARTSKQSKEIYASRSIQQGEELSTGDNSSAVVQLQDTVGISFFSDSHVAFVQLLPTNIVLLEDKGVVNFQNPGKDMLSVRSFDVLSQIKSGNATVTVDPASNTVTVAVQKGETTEAYEDFQNTSNVVTVAAGKTFVFDDTNKIGIIE